MSDTPIESNRQIKAFGLNRMDISQREGGYPVPPQAGPILGVEFAGVIEIACRHCIFPVEDS